MIINTGMRTDIPAFYSKWLLKRIEEGFVMVRNPYYKSQVTYFWNDVPEGILFDEINGFAPKIINGNLDLVK